MMNGVSTYSLFAIPRTAVAEVQKQLSNAETEVTTGFLANPVESLGSQIGLDQTLQAQSATLTNMQASNSIVQSMLSASQNALSSISSDAQSFVNDIMTAQNSGDMSTLQTQAQAFLGSLISQLNTTAGGVYIFGGTNNSVQPLQQYSQAAQGETANAFKTAFGMTQSDTQASSITAADMQAFLTGPFASLFTGAAWSSNWSKASSTPSSALISPGQIVTTSATANAAAFQQLASAYVSISDLGLSNLNSSAQQAILSNAQAVASSAVQGISSLQTTLGISQSQITNANSQMQTQSTLIDNWVSKLAGVDPYDAASKLSSLATQLETAYSLTNRITKLSLVNYLST